MCVCTRAHVYLILSWKSRENSIYCPILDTKKFSLKEIELPKSFNYICTSNPGVTPMLYNVIENVAEEICYQTKKCDGLILLINQDFSAWHCWHLALGNFLVVVGGGVLRITGCLAALLASLLRCQQRPLPTAVWLTRTTCFRPFEGPLKSNISPSENHWCKQVCFR